MLMRQNVSNDVRKNPPIRRISGDLIGFVIIIIIIIIIIITLFL